jgi:actin-like protein 6A
MATYMHGGDEVGAVVMDIGTHTTKAGFAGEDMPKAIFPSYVGVRSIVNEEQNDKSMEVDGEEKESLPKTTYYLGQQLSVPRDHMKVESPFSNGVISNWDHIERLVDHAYSNRLGIKSEDHPILMAEIPYQSRQAREQMVSLLFDKFKAPAVFLAKSPVLTAFAHGKYTALVVDSGAYGTCVTPVHDGYALTRSIVRNNYGGYAIDRLVQQVLERCRKGDPIRPQYMYSRTKVGTGKFTTNYYPSEQFANIDPSYHEFSIRKLLHDAKENLFRVSEYPFDEAKHRTMPTLSYEMLDGVSIDVGLERFTVPETLFRPSAIIEQSNHTFTDMTPPSEQNQEMANDALFGDVLNNVSALHQLAFESIMRCDADYRKDFFTNTILTGGNTMFPEVTKRFEKELQAKAPSNIKVKPPISATALTTEKKYSTWIGGSILASLGSFQQMWISRAEYDEHGAVIVHKKCP